MLTKLRCFFGVAVAGVALANSAHAEEAAVRTGAASARLGGEFRAEYLYDNQGLYKRDGYKPSATSGLQVSDAYVVLDGNVNADTEYAFRFNLLNPGAAPDHSPLEYGYGTHWFTKTFGFSIGKERIMQGGWHHMEEGYRTHADGLYAQNLALADYDALFALHLKVAGLATLQVVNDVVADPTSANAAVSGRWNKSAHPTFVLGWLGEFGPVKPLIDFGSYDNNKSRYVDVGVKTEINGLTATLDYHNDNQSYRVATTANPAVVNKEHDVKSSYSLNVAYEVKNVVTPWAYYSYFDNKQASDSAAGLSNRKYNTSTAATNVPGGYNYAWDDNGTVWGVGFDLNMTGKNWNPFVAYVSTSGKFLKAGSTTDTETRTDAQLKIGVLGTI